MLQMFIFLFTGAYRAVPFNATIIIGSLAATTVIFAAVIAVVIAVVLLIYTINAKLNRLVFYSFSF